MLATSMAVPSTTARKLRVFILFVCAGAMAVGAWYVQRGGSWEDEQDVADDDEQPATFGPDGGAQRRRSKKASPRPKKKASDARQAQAAAARHAGVPTAAGPSGPSYETAIAGNNLELAPGTKSVPDLTDAELAGPTHDGTFLDACGVPNRTHMTVKVAIRNGRAVGVSVYALPPSREIAGCVERHVRGLQWPSNAKMDSFVTTY
jgi:hypothetical protein